MYLSVAGNVGDIQISFHPAVFLLTVLFAGLTVYVGGRKPSRMAVGVSPIETLGYRGTAPSGRRRSAGKGRVIWRMARQQVSKDKKKYAVVVLSLATSLSIFLCLVTLLESQGARTMVSNYMDMDLVVKNDTLGKEDRKDWEQLLDKSLLEEIRRTEGVEKIHPLLCTEIVVPWEPEFSDLWMQEEYAVWMSESYEEDREEYQEHPENFASFLVGIDEEEFDYLNETLETPVDRGALLGLPPTIIVSDRAVKDFVRNPLVYKVSIQYGEEYDQETEDRLLSLIQENPHKKDFSHDSKIEEWKYVRKAQGRMPEVGMGIVVILAVIGILNYVNTVTGNIQSRQMDLAILESVGMGRKQLGRMLVLEGLLYAAGTFLLTGTIGLGITGYLYESVNYRRIPFSVPVLPVAGAVLLCAAVCVAVPLLTYRSMEKRGTIVERIRRME